MKIGILTFQRTVNYGANMQAYALQKYLNKLGADCETIDYTNEAIDKIERPIDLKSQKSIKGFAKYLLLHKHQQNKWNAFNNFTQENIKFSPKVYHKNDIAEVANQYDKFVVGSDQVWNTNITNKDYTYFLDFVKDDNKKYSYAASFGYSSIPESEVEKNKELLNKFKMLNVREKQGKEIINSISNKDVNVVVDPTFLLTKSEWEELIGKKDAEQDYILVYMPNFTKEVFEFIRDLGKKEKCKIIFINDSIRKFKNMKVLHDASPEKFLELLRNAKYVVTGSFHAICLSIIFERNFFYMLNEGKSRNAKFNSRITNLIELAGIKDRRIVDGTYIAKEDIDYAKVKERMQSMIDSSKKILQEIVEE